MSQSEPFILVIEDDPPMRRMLRTGLCAQGFKVRDVESGHRGIQEVRTQKPDVIILDLGLPDMDGVDLIRTVRGWSWTPIIVLSARSQETQKIGALDAGGDDYLTKPFSFGELLARIRVVLRYAALRETLVAISSFGQGRLTIDLERRIVTVAGESIHLTPIQYRLLVSLVQNSGKVMTHRQLMREAWGPGYQESTHYLRIYISQLRKKLEADPARPGLLFTESGVGYRFVGPDLVAAGHDASMPGS